MFECFSKTMQAISIKPYTSSSGFRNTQRANAANEVITSSLVAFTPVAIIPTKLAQFLTSTYSLFRADVHTPEKIVHLLEANIACAQMILAIMMLFKSTTCASDTDSTLCQTVLVTQLLYKGVLLAGWIPSEFTKDPYTLAPQQSRV